MAAKRSPLSIWRYLRPEKRRGVYRPDGYGNLPGLIVNLKKDEHREGSHEETPLQTIIRKVMHRPVKPTKVRQGTRRVATMIGQLRSDRQIKRTGGTEIRPMMLIEAGLSFVVVTCLVVIFLRDLSQFLNL